RGLRLTAQEWRGRTEKSCWECKSLCSSSNDRRRQQGQGFPLGSRNGSCSAMAAALKRARIESSNAYLVRVQPDVRKGRTCRFDRAHRNGRLRRYAADADARARSAYRSDGSRSPPLSGPAASSRPALLGPGPYARARRLRASWIEAMVTKVARVSARFWKSLASRRLRPNQEKVRSTTQRRGSTTKPFTSSLRLAIAKRSNGT